MVEYTDTLDKTFHALAHPIRREMLARLTHKRFTVLEMAQLFDLSLNGVSKHLKVLEQAELIHREIQGRTHYCSLESERLREVAEWLDYYRHFWEGRLDALESFLEKKIVEGNAMSHAQRDPRHTLKITRIIPAPRKEVFEAWTTAESLKQWICPEGSSVSFIELDVRVGGTFRIEMQHADEGEMVLTGVYREIRPPEKLVFTWASKHTHYRDSLVTLDFFARGEATELILLQTQLPDEEAVERHTAAWTHLLEHLAVSLQKSDRRRLQ